MFGKESVCNNSVLANDIEIALQDLPFVLQGDNAQNFAGRAVANRRSL
jgi:hypothetical protein